MRAPRLEARLQQAVRVARVAPGQQVWLRQAALSEPREQAQVPVLREREWEWERRPVAASRPALPRGVVREAEVAASPGFLPKRHSSTGSA